MFRLYGLVVVVTLATFTRLALTEECNDLSFGHTLQDPEDCHGFFLCHGGEKLQQYCEHGMKYDKDLGKCIVGKCPPCNCIVDPGSGTPTVTPATDTPTTTPTATPTDESTSSNIPTDTSTDTATDVPTSTPTDESTSTSLPTDTTTGIPTATPTDESTSTSLPTDTTTDTTTDIPTATPTDISTSIDSNTSTSTVDPLVSCDNIPDGSFFAHREHCRNYWVCRNGIPILLYCEKGSWFDEVNDVCNFRHLVNCPANID